MSSLGVSGTGNIGLTSVPTPGVAGVAAGVGGPAPDVAGNGGAVVLLGVVAAGVEGTAAEADEVGGDVGEPFVDGLLLSWF